MWSVFFVFLSYLDRNFVKGEFLSHAFDAEKESKELFYMLNNTLCAKTSIVGDYQLHQVTDGAEEVRSVHDSDGKLLDCSIIQNQMQVKSFMHVCRLGLRNQKSSDLKMSLTGVAEAKANCNKLKLKGEKNVIQATKEPSQKKIRTKRGFTYPGTLWCGAGNIADHYEQLGEFQDTDKCCRVHDHCPYVIHAFSSNYGYTNFKWHSLSHCDCDNALKDCLRFVNDTSSRVVGQAFFNVIEVPCFEFSFEEQCVERHWYGVCKKYDRVPVAVIKESIPYDFGGIDVIDVLTITPPKNKESNKEKNNETESATQSTFSEPKTASPEEPSLTNVVTAAEDFIKVLATVSTSQSSSTDAAKGESQNSDKKKKKTSGKKKKQDKKRRGKGKGRKKNKKLDVVLKVDEAAPTNPSNTQPEEVMGKNQFVEETPNSNLRIKENNFMNSELDAVGTLSNKMMRDDPEKAMNDDRDATSSFETDKETVTQEIKHANDTELVSPSPRDPITSSIPDKPKAKPRQRGGKKKLHKINPSIVSQRTSKEEVLGTSPTKDVSFASTTESYITTLNKEVTVSRKEKRPLDTYVVKTKRPSLRRKKIIASSTEELPHETTSLGSQVSTSTKSPTEILERLGLERLQNQGLLINPQVVKDTTGRRRVIKICYEAVLPDVADTTSLSTLIEKDSVFQLKDPEINTTPLTSLQTHTLPMPTRRPGNSNVKRRKDRRSRDKQLNASKG
ncbi:hypothetical protein DNTS_029980 [Danionella cerebrum]|uniref:phospholipase A2 n=1 Tax=Danionella cerebrum TaxID=2873325 RepID=A0A553RFJ8_9TELE|nr:hypothetical protein DNTS_029980 [Danionella translucida]